MLSNDKKLDIGIPAFTEVCSKGKPWKDYYISRLPYYLDEDGDRVDSKIPVSKGEFAHIRFQIGDPRGPKGVNGCDVEDIIAIALHRLRRFQWGTTKNDKAIKKLEEALHIIHDLRYEEMDVIKCRYKERHHQER